MAVQIPDPGQGDNKTGDNEYVFRKKVQNNFSDPNNAASRLVGNSVSQVPLCSPQGIGLSGWGGEVAGAVKSLDDYAKVSSTFRVNVADPDVPKSDYGFNTRCWFNTTTFADIYLTLSTSEMFIRQVKDVGTTPVKSAWAKVYTSKNTTTDGNGFIKPSSPVLRVFSDRIEGNTDGDLMAATYTKNGVGDYTITGTTGLRTDGWYITIPNDINGNPHVAVTLDDTDGVITLRSYVRIFDMTTFKFVPDLNQPLDIPDGRWIDLRFNDLPAEPMPEV